VWQLQRVLEVERPDALLLTGGGAQFSPALYNEVMRPYRKDIIAGQLIIGAIDTIPDQIDYLKEGLSTINVGQGPAEMGVKTLQIILRLADGQSTALAYYTGVNVCRRDNISVCLQ